MKTTTQHLAYQLVFDQCVEQAPKGWSHLGFEPEDAIGNAASKLVTRCVEQENLAVQEVGRGGQPKNVLLSFDGGLPVANPGLCRITVRREWMTLQRISNRPPPGLIPLPSRKDFVDVINDPELIRKLVIVCRKLDPPLLTAFLLYEPKDKRTKAHCLEELMPHILADGQKLEVFNFNKLPRQEQLRRYRSARVRVGLFLKEIEESA